MSIISGSIPNLINGVSQQPFALRLASQAEEQINCYSSIVEGLTKRPPSKHVARLQSNPVGASHLHIINRDQLEKYVVVAADGDLKVYDFGGTPRTVNFPHGKAYLNNAGANFSMVTVADYTFIVNKDQQVYMDGNAVAPSRGAEGLVYVRQGNYLTNYRIIIDGTWVVEYQTSQTEPSTIGTVHIAAQLAGKLGANPDFGVGIYGSALHIVRRDGRPFTLRTEDSLGDTAMVSFTNKVQSFTSLPAKAVDGYHVEITGSATNAFDNYFVQYEATGTAGVWREIPKPGRTVAFNAASMPHVLVREANGSFTFKQADWDRCGCGDSRISPEPSFVGSRISDIFFYRNRLGFIADENVIFSRSADFFSFWRTTATSLLDTDPIDVAVSHVKVSLLRHAIPFNETLLLFSDQTQFVLGADQALTPATVSISQATEFETSLRAKPVGSGAFVYFTTVKGGSSSVREYFVDGQSQQKDANDVTSHVPRYIPGTITKLTASTNEDILVALSDTSRSELFVYKFYYSGQEKVQSSWSRWRFGADAVILNAEFIESTLWLLIQRADGIYLERLDIEPGQLDGELNFNTHLDRRFTRMQSPAIAYYPTQNVTHVTLPYALAPTERVQFVSAGNGGPRPKGFVIDPIMLSATLISVPGNWTTTAFRVGRVYEMRYTFSPLLVRESANGGGQIANTEGRIQLRRMLVNYAETGYFRFEVTPFRRDTYTYLFTGRVLGSAKTLLGQVGIETGSFKFAIMANNMQVKIELVNDTPLPTRLLNADWEAQYSVRTKRMT